MTRCRDIEEQLSLHVDDLLDPAAADGVRAHVAHCAACAGLLADLRHIASAAKRLGPIAPPAHLYARLVTRLPSTPSGSGTGPAPGRPLWHWAGIAATVVAATGLVWFVLGGGQPGGSGAPSAPTMADRSETVTAEFEIAIRHYERAVSDLETAASAADWALDPAVATAVRTGLTTLDHAIAESRNALDVDPASEPARISLFEALRRKVDLLQTTVLIVNDAHPAEAARPVNTTEREL
jgi:anti-sigma factor RsiW